MEYIKFLHKKNMLLSIRADKHIVLLGIKDDYYDDIMALIVEARRRNSHSITELFNKYGIVFEDLILIGDSSDISNVTIEPYLQYQRVGLNKEYLCYPQGRFGTPGVTIHDDGKSCCNCTLKFMGNPKYVAVAKLNERSVERLGLVLQTRSNPKLQDCVYLSM